MVPFHLVRFDFYVYNKSLDQQSPVISIVMDWKKKILLINCFLHIYIYLLLTITKV